MIDLHIHTTRSDGQFSPKGTMRLAKKAGVTVAAVTDHDTVAGLAEAAEAAKNLEMDFFPGIELSVQGERELHILGYGIDRESPELLTFCKAQKDSRVERVGHILAYLARKGVPVTIEDVLKVNHGAATGRPHFARTLVEKGYVSSTEEAFDKFLTTDEYYEKVERKKATPAEGMEVLRRAGGVAVLAHPHWLHLSGEALEKLVRRLIADGLSGIEVYYSRHTPEQTREYLSLAKKYDLLVTCGSDFHGYAVKPDISLGTGFDGNLGITDMSIPERLHHAIEKVAR